MQRLRYKTDGELVQYSLKGREDAFRELVDRYRHGLFGYCLKSTSSRADAEDVFQETLIKIWKGLAGYRPTFKFSSWIFSIAHHAIIDHARNKKAKKLFLMEINPVSDDHPEQLIEAKNMALQIQKILQSLSEKQRQVFLLRQEGQMSFKEIAELMHEPLNTVLSHMHYAVKKLKKSLRA